MHIVGNIGMVRKLQGMERLRRQPGRPTKPAGPGEKTTLSLRVTPELKRRIDDAAKASGRNLSQEAEARLDHSFRDEQQIEQALGLAYGRQLAGLILVLARAMSDAIRNSNLAQVLSASATSSHWPRSPWEFDQAKIAVDTILEAFRPPGEVVAPAKLRLTGIGAESGRAIGDFVESPGEVAAHTLLHAIIRGGITAELEEWAVQRRAQLGDLACSAGAPSSHVNGD
jgi:hypothetical protein